VHVCLDNEVKADAQRARYKAYLDLNEAIRHADMLADADGAAVASMLEQSAEAIDDIPDSLRGM
jgi:hypothetical protein